MFGTRLASRSSRLALAQCRNSLLLLSRQKQPQVPNLYSQYHSLLDLQYKVVPVQVSLLHNFNLCGSAIQRFGISSSASPQPNDKDATQSGNEQGSATENDAAAAAVKTSTDAAADDEKDVSESESDSECDLSKDELVKLVIEKEEQLKTKQEELRKIQDKALRACAEMQNSMDRTKREAENMKKFAVQDFAKSLLDVADNLSRASSVVKESFAKIDESKDSAGAVPLLKTLLEGVAMTEKQLAEVFKKYGLQRYDPVNEEFDPHRHNAVFQVPDPSKPPNTVAVVLKAGYMLHDRVIRPAEVGVTQSAEN